MKTKRPKNETARDCQTWRIRLVFSHPSAETVCVAGSFNDWRPAATPMIRLNEGRWVKELALPPGTYEYCLVVDGAYCPDPLARETVTNPFGGVNSVLRVAVPA